MDIEVGGTESNMAIGLARLGLRPIWLSRLTNNPMGRLIAGALAAHGVDTSHVVWTDDDRVGVLFFEIGKAPLSSRVIYDRQGSAVSRMRPEELQWGAATAALKYTIPGDAPLVERHEVEALLQWGRGGNSIRR